VFFSGLPEQKKNITDFLHEDFKETLGYIFSAPDKYELQPYIAHGVFLQGLPDPVTLQLYRHDHHGYCLIFIASQQVHEEVLLSREERKWAERLQIMLFGISHELKTPLAIARGYAEMSQNDAEKAMKVLEALDKISTILNSMTEPLRQINNRNDYIDVGHSIELYCRTTPYIEPTKRYIGYFEADIEYASGKYIRLNKPRFYQIINNLFENSIRATAHLNENAIIKIRTRECEKPYHPNCVVIEFEDNGYGMTEEIAQKVFIPYYTTRAKDTGSGLGGYFIYQFVMDAGGHIYVDSEVGVGTTFTIHLPYVCCHEVPV
jgi:signal transduction histidine kinase